MTLDSLIFSLFLALNLIIGLGYGRAVKTLRQYAIGNKTFWTGTITASMVATHMGGDFLFYGLENTYARGLLFIIPTLLVFVCQLVTARFVVVRMGAYLQYVSVAEAMYNLYGHVVGLITAVSGLLFLIGRLAIQFKAILKILFLVFDLEGVWVTCITAGIVMAYSMLGGMRSVTLTDVLQCIAICICLPILCIVVYQGGHDTNPIKVELTTCPQFSWKSLHVFRDTVKWMRFVSICCMVMLPSQALSPASFQRIAMAHSVQQAKRAFTYAAFLTLLLIVLILLLGVLLVAHHATLHPKELVQYMTTTYTGYPAFKGLLAIVVVALAMSTADSFLHAASVLVVNVMMVQKIKEKKKPCSRGLAMARICSGMVGLLALLLTCWFDDLLQLVLLTNRFFMPIYFPPFLLAIFGFQSTPTVVLSGMIAGGITVVLWHFFLPTMGVDSILPGIVANCLLLFVSHALLPKPKNKAIGWIQSPVSLLETSQKLGNPG